MHLMWLLLLLKLLPTLQFHDQLVQDLGYPTLRKGWIVAAELFGYLKNADYIDVINAGSRQQ